MGAGVGEEYERKCADRRNGHKKILVEHLAVLDISRRFEKNVVAGNRIRNKVQHEFRIHRIAFAAEPNGKGQQLRYGEYQRKQNERKNNALSPAPQFLIHGNNPP